MNQSVRKFISSTLAVTTAFGFSAIGLGTAFAAGQLQQSKATLSDTRVGSTSNYTFSFKVASTTSILSMRFRFRTDPSQGSTVPGTSSFSSTSASLTSVDKNGTPSTGWSLVNTTNGELSLTNSGTGIASPTVGDTVNITIGNISNNDLSSNCDGIVDSTDTCYIRIGTFSDTAYTTPVDTGVTTYTVMTAITATATVDPTLTFQITGVDGTTLSNITTNDALSDSGTSTGVLTTATSIPFTNVKVGQVKIAQQLLQVKTNANNGYNVYSKFNGVAYLNAGAGNYMMTGTQGTNKLDAFTASGATWSSPQVFSLPVSTTANTNTGWLGQRTNNPGVSGFSTLNYYGPPSIAPTTNSGNAVMTKTSPDDGVTPTAVTFKIGVDAYQPADAYTGVMSYTVVASY